MEAVELFLFQLLLIFFLALNSAGVFLGASLAAAKRSTWLIFTLVVAKRSTSRLANPFLKSALISVYF